MERERERDGWGGGLEWREGEEKVERGGREKELLNKEEES